MTKLQKYSLPLYFAVEKQGWTSVLLILECYYSIGYKRRTVWLELQFTENFLRIPIDLRQAFHTSAVFANFKIVSKQDICY